METIQKQIDKNTLLIFSFNGINEGKREVLINGIYKESKKFKANKKQWEQYKNNFKK